MITSATTELHEPAPGERVPLGTFAYFRTRNKNRAYSLVVREMDRVGISKAELARRLGKEPAQISRYLNGPGNWTLDTLSDFLFAISAAEAEYKISHPLEKARRNDTAPVWLVGSELREPARQHKEEPDQTKTPALPRSAIDANNPAKQSLRAADAGGSSFGQDNRTKIPFEGDRHAVARD